MLKQPRSLLRKDSVDDSYIFNIIFNHSNDAIMIVDPMKGAIIKANPKACQLLGYSMEKLLNTSIADIHPFDLDEMMAFSGDVLKQGHGWTDRLTCVTADGQRLPSEISASIVEIDGRTLMISMVRDVSQRVKAEIALQQLNTHLESEVKKRTTSLEAAQAELVESERLRAIGEFTAMIIHEVRNPLNVIYMALEHISNQELPESSRKRVALGEESMLRLNRLLSEILLYAKPQQLQTRTINLQSLISDCVSELENLPQAQGKKIELQLPNQAVCVIADPDKMKQVVINLLGNACDAAPEGTTIAIDMAGGEKSWFQIHNGGDPIPAPQLEQMTKPFFTTKQNGTGLGLAIVKQIIDKHDGTLTFSSSANDGTIFRVELPTAAPDTQE
jgi:PAS domain S-box-containing protein